jgi:ABC-type Mn2+/Zn2+ transport system permease subunit
MIDDFISSWPLFHNTYLAGWFLAAMLSVIGVIVVARNQVFVGAAISQASTLGIALALWASTAIADAPVFLSSDAAFTLTSVLFSIAASILTTRAGGTGNTGRESPEAITAWVFLLGAAGSILVVSHSPHGVEEVHRLVASSIIGATTTDVVVFGALAIATAGAAAVWYRPILLWVMDPLTAGISGARVPLLNAGVSIWLGLAVGLSIRASGTLYTFGCLVLPALVAKSLCREVRTMFLVAPVIALLTAVTGFVVANHYDFPPAQVTVTLLCLLVPVAWVLRAMRR